MGKGGNALNNWDIPTYPNVIFTVRRVAVIQQSPLQEEWGQLVVWLVQIGQERLGLSGPLSPDL
eukprot:1145672-Pelagomonas_calceolata.AAC.5